jgi:hypothetical protein
VPSGTITFKDGSTTLGTAALDPSGNARLTMALALGSHSITAAYGADANFTASTSPVLIQSIGQAATATAVTASPNPAVFGQSVTLTATVSAASPGAGTPDGMVTFKDGTVTLGTGMLNSSGQASLGLSNLTVAGHAITAVYGGSANFSTSISALLNLTVNPVSTATTLASSLNPSVFNQNVTFTATVAVVAPGTGTPVGTVAFKDEVTTIGVGTLNASGQATFTISILEIGTHHITAVYNGFAGFSGSTSPVVAQTVNGNLIPVLLPPANQTVPPNQLTITVPLSASDDDGDTLSFSATGQSLAYVLNQRAGGLTYYSIYDNDFGAGEKWLASSNQWYFILPNGNLYQWDRSLAASGTLLGNVGTSYYADPRLIGTAPANQPRATFSVSGSTLTITRDPAWVSAMVVTVVVNDGQGGTDTKSFTLTIGTQPPVLFPLVNEKVSPSQLSIPVPLAAIDPDGHPLSFSATGQSLAYNLNQQAGGLTYYSVWDNDFGAGEKWLASGTQWYFILPNGNFYQWDGSLAASGTLLGNVGTSYYADPRLIATAQVNQPHATFSIVGNILTITRDPAWVSGIVVTVTVSDGQGGMDVKTFIVTVAN